MISERVQAALAALAPRPNRFEMSSTSRLNGSLSACSQTSAALGMVAKKNPVGAVLLEAVYTGRPRLAEKLGVEFFAVTYGTHLVEQSPLLAKSIVRLAVGELCFLAGSRRCSCRGRNKTCEFCGGTGIRPNTGLSERARLAMLGEDVISRHKWRSSGLGDIYDKLLSRFAEELDDAARRVARQLRDT